MFTAEQRHLGQSKLPAQAHESALEGDTYSFLKDEMNKLVNLHASETVDWQKVASLAQQFLQHEAKDLNVATWLVTAWTKTQQAAGLAAGLQVLNDIHQHYWSDMTPPLKRLRARRNQMQWFIEQINRLIELEEAPWTLSANEYESAVEHSKALDAFWQQNDSEAPALYSLVSLVQSMQPESQIAPPVPSNETLPITSTATLTPLKSAEVSAMEEISVLEDLPTLDSSQLEKNIDLVFSLLMKGLGEFPDSLLKEPLLYRLNRTAAWLTLEQAPPAQEGNTRLAPPSLTEIETLERLERNQDSLDLLRFIESRVFSHRYWLDLQRLAYLSAAQLPDGQQIAESILAETRLLIQRVPDLVQLHFQDGTPFANAQTKTWLAALTQANLHDAAPISTETSAPVENTATVIALLAAAQAEANVAKNALTDLEQRLTNGLSHYINVT